VVGVTRHVVRIKTRLYATVTFAGIFAVAAALWCNVRERRHSIDGEVRQWLTCE
jgi:hypothetical protein